MWVFRLQGPYIEGTKFLIRCDHKALKWILTTTACTENQLNRWRILLSEFDFDVEYKSGFQHAVADALSRIPTEGLDMGPISQEIPTVRVTTRSGAVLDPRLPENRETARIPLCEQARSRQPMSSDRGSRSYLTPLRPRASIRRRTGCCADVDTKREPSSFWSARTKPRTCC